MPMSGKNIDSNVTSVPQAVPLPVGQLLKTAAADAKTTNALLLVLVLCMSGFMPEQFQTLCGL